MSELEYQQQLRELLAIKRQLLHHREMQLARAGSNADPAIIIARDDLSREVAGIEARLGVAWPAAEPPRKVVHHEEEAPPMRDDKRADIQHHQQLLSTHRGNLAHYRASAKAHGGVAFSPIYVQNGMAYERSEIARVKDVLRRFFSVVVEDLPGDE